MVIAFPVGAGVRDRSSTIELNGSPRAPGNYIYAPELSVAPGTPSSGWASIYVIGNDIFFKDDAGVATSMIGAAAGGASNLDEAYDGGGSGAGNTIAVDQGAVVFAGANAGNNVFELTNTGTGNLIDITNTGTGKDIDGTSSTWSFSKLGVLTLANGLTIDNLVDNVLEINENSEDLLLTFDSNLLDLSSTTGVVQIDLFDGSATTITKAADGAADDLTISVTGAQNSSLVLSSSGTAADALQITASAGGIDIAAAGAAANEDIDITTSASINLSSTEDAANALYLLTNAGTSETIVITNTQGTNDAAINIDASAGGIDIDSGKSLTLNSAENTTDSVVISSSVGGIDIIASGAAATEDIDITATGSSVNIVATEAAADAIVLNASTALGGIDITSNHDIDITTTGAAGEDISIINTGGSVIVTATEAIADAIVVSSSGGVDITSAATFDIDLTATGGRILGIATEAAADQFKVDAQGTVAGNAINLETTDGGILLNADGAANGDIGIDAADDLTLTSAGDLTLAVTGTLSAGGTALTNVRRNAEVSAATNILTAAECGKTLFLNSDTEFQTTLPAISTAAIGCEFEFIVTAAAAGANYTVITGNTKEAIINGFINVANVAAACGSEDTITFVDGNAVGDNVRLISDGTSWIIQGEAVTAAKLTCTDEV